MEQLATSALATLNLAYDLMCISFMFGVCLHLEERVVGIIHGGVAIAPYRIVCIRLYVRPYAYPALPPGPCLAAASVSFKHSSAIIRIRAAYR